MLNILFLSLVLSSCGLIDKFKTTDQTTDSNETAANMEENVPVDDLAAATEGLSEGVSEASEVNGDDLFSKSMEEATDQTNVAADGAIKSLQDEFSSAGPAETQITEKIETVKDIPVIVQESIPEIKEEVQAASNDEGGGVKNYTVKKGETLMQIAFTLYGDVSRWKDIKNMNSGSMRNNNSLKAGTVLKYRAPSRAFVWNPSGTPHLIKTGETLGTISNSVYATPKKWKSIWENNKPLIKNPNLIYAGFTLYYKNQGSMANYVQPQTAQPVKAVPVLVENTESLEPVDNMLTTEEVQVDEAIQSLSAPQREIVERATTTNVNSAKEIDLINNVSMPLEQLEIEPDIDEEIQTL